jgi:fibronectin-binding autotransporter adhesin
MAAVVITAGVVAGLLSASATAATPCVESATTDVYTPPGAATTGDWTDADWSLGAPPSGTEVACWNAGIAVTVSTAVSVDSIQAGGDLSIVSGGTVTLTSASNDSSVGDLFLEGGGELDGPTGRTLTVTGNFDWGSTGSGAANLNAAPSSGLAVSSGPLTIDGSTSAPDLLAGSVNTGGSPVSITNAGFQASGGATLTTTSTITLGSGVNVGGSGATFTAAGIAATGAPVQTYGFGTNSLVLTGGTTTVTSGNELDTGPLALQGGTLQVDGTLVPSPSALTLTGGTLQGTGTVNGAVVNTSGTVSPGDATPGLLTVAGNYSQGSGATLAIALASSSVFGQLAVQGAALDGTLTLTDAGGFTPSQAGTFQILT